MSGDSLIGPHLRAEVRLSSTLRGGHSVSLGSKLATDADSDVGAEMTVGYRDERYVRYFGLGPTSRGADEAFYRQSTSWIGLVGRKSLNSASAAAVDLILSGSEPRSPGNHESPPLESRFSGLPPPGYGSRSVGAEIGMSLTIGTGREMVRSPPADLGFARAAVFRSIDGSDASYLSSRLELQGSRRIGHSGGFIAARGLFHYLDPLGPEPVPFQRMLSNGGPDLLRGFQDMRWRDRGIALGNVEFHLGVWESSAPLGPALGAYLLTDVGQVFAEPNEVTLGDATFSAGAGLRLVNVKGFASVIEIARSREDLILRLRTDRIFQDLRGENFRGTNSIRGI